MPEPLSYKGAGVDIDKASETKREMAGSLKSNDRRVLNQLGAFASLYDACFDEYEHPVLVLKTEEPGSKQKLSFKFGRVEQICYDMINHLVNDIIVMGAKPLAVQDAIICDKIEKDTVKRIVATIAQACKDQDCSLTGGETSEQPGVVEPGTYILTSSIVGIVEKSKIIDGSAIVEGDTVLAIASNGLHTNGYTLVRALMNDHPDITELQVDEESFIDTILRPHKCYHHSLKGLFHLPQLHGMAHITGGGIQDNLCRILPEDVQAVIDLARIRIPPVFKIIRNKGNVTDTDMLRTFNIGVGMVAVIDASAAESVQSHLARHNCESYAIGHIEEGNGKVTFRGTLNW